MTGAIENVSNAAMELGPNYVFAENVVLEEEEIVDELVAQDQACKYNLWCMSCTQFQYFFFGIVVLLRDNFGQVNAMVKM